MVSATPVKLKSGAWGARTTTPVSVGDSIQITTRAGKSWIARVSAVIASGAGWCLVATSSGGTTQHSSGRDSAGHSIRSGASYRHGITAPGWRACPMCGSRECARAWNPHDLCDED